MVDEWTINTLKVMSHSGKRNTECLGVKEKLYWDFLKTDKYIWPILHNLINLGTNVFHDLLNYGIEYIEMLYIKEDMVRNSLLIFDSSIVERVDLREDFDISEEYKEPRCLKNFRRKDMTPIIPINDENFHRDLKIDELYRKKELISNDVYNIKRQKYKLKEMLKESRKFGLDDRICTLFQMYYIKR